MGCSCTPKFFLGMLSLIFWAAAAGLFFVGIWVYKEYQHFDELADSVYTLVPATIMMGCGIFLFLLGIIGCVGAFKEQKCLLALFFTVLLIIFCGVLTVGVLGYVYRGNVDSGVQSGMNNALKNYLNDSAVRNQFDFMQNKLQCCGLHNESDWMATPWHQAHQNMSYPESCCKDKHCNYGKNDTQLYQNGCFDLLKNQFLQHLGIIAGVAAAFAVVQLLGMVCSCVLLCRRKQEVPYIGLNNADGLRV